MFLVLTILNCFYVTQISPNKVCHDVRFQGNSSIKVKLPIDFDGKKRNTVS